MQDVIRYQKGLKLTKKRDSVCLIFVHEFFTNHGTHNMHYMCIYSVHIV